MICNVETDQSFLEGKELRNSVLAESWEYAEANTQHLTHNIHRYSGKFIPQIAARAISTLTKAGELVVDPYCGSGTTLVEAALLGRKAIGFDLNPLAVLIARTKITPVPIATLQDLKTCLGKYLRSFESEVDSPLFRSSLFSRDEFADIASDYRFTDPWFTKWFQPNILEALVVIDHAINKLHDDSCKNIARIAFSDILRKSSNAHSGYPNVMYDKRFREKTYPIRPFLQGLDRVCEMVASLQQTDCNWKDVEVRLGNAVNLPIPDCAVDAIVTHPPYIGSIPYAEYGALSLKWLGEDPKRLDHELTGGRRQSSKVVENFEDAYSKMIMEASRVLKPGRYAFFMVGNPVVKGKVIDLELMTIELANKASLNLIVSTDREGVNRRANKMGAEHLLFFKKVI